MDNLFVGNVSSTFSGASLPALLSSVPCALWKSLGNDPGQVSDYRRKVTDLKSESVTDFIPES